MVFSVSFSSDVKILASGSFDHTIKLWEVDTGRLVKTLEGHNWTVTSVSFSPDAKTLVSGSGDQTIKLWEVSSGRLLKTVEAHNAVSSVSFSPDGKYLAWTAGKRIQIMPILDEITKTDPEELLKKYEKETGMKVIGMDIHFWNPFTGKIYEKPLRLME